MRTFEAVNQDQAFAGAAAGERHIIAARERPPQKNDTSAAPSARARELPKKSSSELFVGPRRRDLSRTIRRRRKVAWPLRVTPVKGVMTWVPTAWEMSRRTSSERRFSRKIGSSRFGFMDFPTRFGVVTHQKPRNLFTIARLSVGQSVPVYTGRDVSMYKRKGKYLTMMAPTPWDALPMLESTRRLNERGFALLARRSNDAAAREASPIFARADLWARLDEHAYERAGRCPVLLLNLNFHPLEWWQRAAEGHAGSSLNPATPLFGALEVAPLLRALLLEAWSITRVNA